MVTIQTADNALKSFYLDAVTEALDLKTNPLLAKIKRSSTNVTGKEVRKLVASSINGGIAAGSETGDLPASASRQRLQFVSTLKNLYGTIEISDKALRASANNEGAFVNLLNDEMQSLIKSASFNFGRMLFGDGTGYLGKIDGGIGSQYVVLDDVSGIYEGMVVDFFSPGGTPDENGQGLIISYIDRKEKTIKASNGSVTSVAPGSLAYVHGSRDYELTGLKAIFEDAPIYGLERNVSSVLKPYKITSETIDENILQTALDTIEQNSGSSVNFIVCSWGVRRALINALKKNNLVMNSVELEGGFKALSFNGIPVVVDRFCPEGTMYLLNTDDFEIHQLCDWQWLEGEDGKILKQIPGKPVYTATLVKYAELMCGKPCGQGMISGIQEA